MTRIRMYVKINIGMGSGAAVLAYQAKMEANGRPVACYDPHGYIVAVAAGMNEIKLFDRRKNESVRQACL
jgi:hypothetical protein